MDNTGNSIIIGICLILGMQHKFEWYLIIFIIFAMLFWQSTDSEYNKLVREKLRLEIDYLKGRGKG